MSMLERKHFSRSCSRKKSAISADRMRDQEVCELIRPWVQSRPLCSRDKPGLTARSMTPCNPACCFRHDGCMPGLLPVQVRAHAVEVLKRTENEELLYYLLQLVQALRYEAADDSRLAAFLVQRAISDPTLAIFLHWSVCQSTTPFHPFRADQTSACDRQGQHPCITSR